MARGVLILIIGKTQKGSRCYYNREMFRRIINEWTDQYQKRKKPIEIRVKPELSKQYDERDLIIRPIEPPKKIFIIPRPIPDKPKEPIKRQPAEYSNITGLRKEFNL